MRLLLLFTVLLLGSAAYGQKYSFQTFSTEEGLPQSQVNGIAQDKDGYLWIGTIGGLTRFNGGEFVPFTSKEGLLNNRITSLDYFEDKLWIGHDGGISYIDNGEVRKIAFTGDDKSRPVQKILRFKNRIIICSNAGGLFEMVGNALVNLELGNFNTKRVRSGYIHNGELYLATRDGVLVTADLKSYRLFEEFGEHSFSDITGDENRLIGTTYDSLLVQKDLQTGDVTFENPGNLGSIYGCHYDSDKSLWLYGKSGIVRFADNEKTTFNRKSGLPLDAINCVYQDSEKNIWIGSQGKGMFRFTGLKFKYFDQNSGYVSDLFTCGFEDINGTSYFGTFDQGVLFKPHDEPMQRVELDNDNLTVWAAIANVDGKHWFGTHRSLVSLDANGNTEIFENRFIPSLPGRKIVAFERIDEHSMYIAGNEGVSLYKDGKITKLGKKDDEFLGTVRDMAIIDDLLYCVSNLGIFVYRDGDFYPFGNTSDLICYNIVKDDIGNAWVGAASGLFHLKDGKLDHFTLLNDDLRANVVNFLAFRDGVLYVGTNNGLFELRRNGEQYRVKRYATNDGIPDLETNLNSSYFDLEGNLWFGTSSGLVCYHLNKKSNKASKPVLHLKSILLNYETFDYGAFSSNLRPNGLPQDLELPFNKNNLVFNFDGVSLLNHAQLKFQFKLEGLNDKWSPLSSVSTISFTNLPAGEYLLKVRAVDIDGRSSEIVEMPLIVNEAFYKTWWFILLCTLLVGVIVLVIFRMRLRRIRQMNENEMLSYQARLASLEQKSLNASMNRHFIFNALNSIQYFINTRDRLSANKYLTNFAQLIRKNLDTATSADNRITLEEEIVRIQLYLSLESMRFKDKFEYEIITNDIDLESYKIPTMIMQPFIENSIIHGILPKEHVKGLISIVLTLEDDLLEILIEDNGIGVNQSMSRKAMDSGDHRSQGMEITSKRIELMQKFSDRSMELIGPKEIVGNDGSINGTYVLLKIRVENLAE